MQEDDAEVEDDKASRDAKSRFVLRRLIAGDPKCERGDGKICFCPFCGKRVARDRNSVIDHAVGVGRSGSNTTQPHVKAQHAALGVYLKMQRAWDYSTGLDRPPLKLRIKKMKEGAAAAGSV